MLNIESGLTVFALVYVLVEALGVCAAVHAVMTAKTSQGAIAWGISLVTFPWLTLPLYAVFGRNKFHGYVSLRHLKDEKIHHIIDRCTETGAEANVFRENQTDSEIALTRLADLPITRFNHCRLLINGDETFSAIFDAIERAEDYILIEFYIIKDDNLGRELKDHLKRKAQQNVRVYFLFDEIGSLKLSKDYIQELKQAGIFTSAFKTTQGSANRFQLNFRNHRKIVVVDGRCAFVGGHNVGDEYRSGHPRLGPWRDTHVEVNGPVVQAIQFCFLEDWYWATSEVPDMNWQLQKAEADDEDALLIASGPADDIETCGLMFTQAINSAKKRIWLASPYFVPDWQIIGALKLAALRGVDVRILLPEKPDHHTVNLATYSFYPNTIPVGIKLYRYQPGFLHQKVFLVDDTCAAVGTANLDNRSFRLNFELTLFNFDNAFIMEVASMLDQDFSNSQLVKINEFTGKRFPFRLAARFARLLSPIL